jgi:hypothetical protein
MHGYHQPDGRAQVLRWMVLGSLKQHLWSVLMLADCTYAEILLCLFLHLNQTCIKKLCSISHKYPLGLSFPLPYSLLDPKYTNIQPFGSGHRFWYLAQLAQPQGGLKFNLVLAPLAGCGACTLPCSHPAHVAA